MKVPFILKDKSDCADGRQITGEVEIDSDGISIRFDGYGTKTAVGDTGEPVYIECWEGELRIVIWPDINAEDPAIVSLEESRVEKYVSEEPA